MSAQASEFDVSLAASLARNSVGAATASARSHARDASRFATAAEDARNKVGDGIELRVYGLRCVQLLRQRLVVSAVFVAPAVRKRAYYCWDVSYIS